ncbi:MAG: biotin synthase BioB [Treponema sp.]|nr:biotin synthase BioB [Treponema sp.]
MDVQKLSREIVNGKRLTREDDLSFFLTCDLQELCKGADYIRENLCGEKVDLCTIINGRSGKCSENCKYCAQSIHNHTNCEIYDFIDEDIIVKEAKQNESEGVNRFSIVTSGRALTGEEFEKAVKAFNRLHKECKIELCASMGFLTEEQFKILKDAGVSRYHDNIESSRKYFPNICTSHTFEGKIETIKKAQKAGLSVCSGGIIGLGESFTDRIDMAMELKELGIKSIPINVLMAIKGTPLENTPALKDDEILRTIAMFRYINPDANIRLAGGRKLLKENGIEAFKSGANAAITGNMLTTTGSTIESDKQMLIKLGRNVTPSYLSSPKECQNCASKIG